MGYETKLIIGTPVEWMHEKGPQLVLEVCRYDLSKAGYDTATGKVLSEARHDGSVYKFFAEDGNGYIDEDLHGEPITAVDIGELIAAMEQDNAEEPYRRFTGAIGMLRPFLDRHSWPNIVCLQWGH